MNRPIIAAVFLSALFAFTVSNAQETVELAASDATISAPFILTNGYLFQPAETTLTNGGRATFTFRTTNAAPYTIEALVEAANTNQNSMFISIDSEPGATDTLWEVPARGRFETNSVCRTLGEKTMLRSFELSAGSHQLIIRGKSAMVKLARIYIHSATPPAPPSGLRILAQ